MKKNIRYSFAFKLSMSVITCVVFTFLAVLVYNYKVAKDTIVEDIEMDTHTLANSTMNRVNNALLSAQQIPEVMADVLESSDFTEEELLSMLRKVVEQSVEIYGSTVSYEPYMFNKDKYFFGPYYYKSGNELKYQDLGGNYNYLKWDWYTVPKKVGHAVWSPTYFDEGAGNIMMVTYSQPFYKNINGKRTCAGVVTCDIDRNWLIDYVLNIKIYQTGYIFMLSNDGSYLVHKKRDRILRDTIFTIAQKENEPGYVSLGKSMINGESGFEKYYSHTLQKNCYVRYMPIKLTQWSLAIVVPEDELYSNLKYITIKLFLIGLLGYLLTLTLIILLARRITSPLRVLADATHVIGEGNLHALIPAIKSTDEVGLLSRSFINMQENLIKYINNLQETTAAKEKIERELAIARDIQQSLLPRDFPKTDNLEIFALVDPAKEVGGDIYDFFFVDDTHLCFAIGDVSGKGVPAALFMAMTKTLLRAKISIGRPSEILKAMNDELCKNNDMSMFVTYFLGIMNLVTGEIEYSNAGHNPPAFCTSDNGCRYFEMEINSPLGFMDGMEYQPGSARLSAGDTFFLYTDGITEAMNVNNEMFSDEKLLEILSANTGSDARTIIELIYSEVKKHAEGAEQSDDITMLAIKYMG